MTLILEEPLTTKRCSCCNKVKKVEEFYKHGIRYRKQRYRPKCIICHKKNIDRSTKRLIQQKHYRKNKEYYFERNIRNKKKYKKAQPIWANICEIRKIYATMRELNVKAGKNLYQVDHIIPLISNIVCGLHVENNLQILTSKENKIKSNIFNPNIYPEQGRCIEYKEKL